MLIQAMKEGQYLPLHFFFQPVCTSFRHCCCVHCRSDHAAGRDEEAAFLANQKSLWRGFIHMHAVAKLVTRAFPVSGIVDHLTEVN